MKNKEISYIRVDASNYIEITRSGDYSDPWDQDDTHTSWYINGLELVNTDEYMSLPIKGPVKKGDKLFLLYAIYSTGNSFHRDYDGCIELINLHRNGNIANLNEKLLREYTNQECEEHETNLVKLYTDDLELEERAYYIPWIGYFENLSYINVDEFSVQ